MPQELKWQSYPMQNPTDLDILTSSENLINELTPTLSSLLTINKNPQSIIKELQLRSLWLPKWKIYLLQNPTNYNILASRKKLFNEPISTLPSQSNVKKNPRFTIKEQTMLLQYLLQVKRALNQVKSLGAKENP